MAVSWGFATLLALTLVALITFSQPVFQSDQAVVGHTQSDLKIAPEGVDIIQARGVTPPQNLLATSLKSRPLQAGSSSSSSSSSSRKRWVTRKLNLQRSLLSPPQAKSQSSPSRRSVLTTFQSDRMVPTGPNPLHNSNRSQVIFP